ncbi:hypothetical protein [Pedobacter endophyticus]|uniref:Uncharacterized protein n=1 Tax=Pedobacter endophyticus TaxID=2789740 RepID=A0A7S9L0T6_9SPHI|nr:hypothetical protein [Pedobacter endophyticus]QPH40410.1 hypothetical protein IZT61_03770 [Pedobacter endophyticus]
MVIVNEDTPTTSLLDLQAGHQISNGLINGTISQIDIQETDSYLMFLFLLDNEQEITVKKIRQVC